MVNAALPSAWRASRIRAAGITLAAYETGSTASDARTVLLLHGLGHWTDGAWGRLVPQLDPALRYLAIDLPGFGASDRPDTTYDAAYFRAVLDAALAALSLQRFALIGHSLGGFIAADLAGAHADRVTHLALIAPAGFSRTPRYLAYALASEFARRLFVPRPSRGFVARIFRRGVADPAALDSAHIDRAYELAQDFAVRRAFASVYAGAIRTFLGRRRLHDRFARFRGPVFCAWGARDRYIGPGALREITRVYPQAETLLLERCGHFPALEEPRRLGAALRAFLAR